MDKVAFTTPDVGRVFIACDLCGRVVPHYRVYGHRSTATGLCKCGSCQFRPIRIPGWKAAFWLFIAGWFWRKTILKQKEWDPRMPIRERA